jgi:hypothetical protein
MWIRGITCEVEHCQHCAPQVWWVVNEAGKPPQFAWKGFPKDGQIVLSKKRCLVLCGKCSGSIQADFQLLSKRN